STSGRRAFVPAGLPSDLLARRPDVLEAEQRLVAANARIGATKALFFPRVSLTGNYGVESVQFSELFTQPAQTWGFGPTASMPLLTFGKVIGQLDAAEAEAEEALHAYRDAALTALRETEDALVDHRKAIEQRAALEAQVRALRRALFLAEVRYREGYTDYVTVLDAQRSLLQAELELVGTERAQAAAAIQVYRALGGGWSPEDPAATLAEPEAPYLP
ncbi:MAG: TolC family protein, partial [Candidatus Methylomirabilis sp.]|nr:TolC family protein [Deltaproteobacteria bacterium]